MSNSMTLTARTDGASKGNPGPAAYGFTVEKDGIVLEENYGYIGETTNNIAEYTACIEALKRMKSLGATCVMMFSDSELMVRQLNGLYRVKNRGLQPLYRTVQKLLGSFDSYEIVHVLRGENTIADGLANKAINEHLSRK